LGDLEFSLLDLDGDLLHERAGDLELALAFLPSCSRLSFLDLELAITSLRLLDLELGLSAEICLGSEL
jgi:hypothetical protein